MNTIAYENQPFSLPGTSLVQNIEVTLFIGLEPEWFSVLVAMSYESGGEKKHLRMQDF